MANLTEVRLLRVPLENDYKDTFYWTNAGNQANWFQQQTIKTMSNCTYQRKEGYIRLDCIYDDISNANYVMYKNAAYNNKWFYAFITKLEYINDGCTYAHIETDVLQTWWNEYEVKSCFIERQHVDDDTIGAHTVPENVEMGEFICTDIKKDSVMDNALKDLCYVIGATVDPTSTAGATGLEPAGSGLYNGIYSGVRYFRYDDQASIDAALEAFAEAGQSDAITGIFMAPKELCYCTTAPKIDTGTAAKSYQIQVQKPQALGNSYVPKNKKLLTYPYTYCLASNGQGGNAIYQWELSNNTISGSDTPSINFSVVLVLAPGISGRLTPRNYKGVSYNHEEGINLGKFPICNFAVDMYTNWITQNGINVATNYLTAGAGLIGSVAAMFTGVGAVAGGIGVVNSIAGIANAVAEQRKAAMVPPQVNGNVNAGDVITASGENNFTFYTMAIREEYAKIIDGFFDMFGYQVNTVGVPLKAHRSKYWYTKTHNANIDGDIPQDDITKIRNIYDAGIRFWRSPANIGDFSGTNSIVS